MKAEEKVKLLQDRLTSAFKPTYLIVNDDSDQHVGHAGHGGGGRHFSIIISSDYFKDMSRVEAHRAIYVQFQDLIPHEIHALKIKII
ncbi:MAG TPA: BolA family protein [Gammaproteobacteria bacterium]|nr:BolA family protein [Gammaproteobacteria bacterium]